MTALAIGAATRPPRGLVAGGAAVLDTTATATCGSSAGAKAVNHACGAWPSACWAVPVLPATGTPAICAAVPVPSSTTPDHHPVQRGGGLGRDRLDHRRRAATTEHVEVRSADHLSDEVRRHQLAAVGDRRADHRHLQRRHPHVALADGGLGRPAAGSGRPGTCSATTRSGIRRSLSNPNRSACSRSASPPSVHAELAERGVAGDPQRVGERDRVVAAARARRRSCGWPPVVCGRSSTRGAGQHRALACTRRAPAPPRR